MQVGYFAELETSKLLEQAEKAFDTFMLSFEIDLYQS